jgi:hypothetical protein
VFKPAFAALASTVELGRQYNAQAYSLPLVKDWKEQCEPFLPNMILYNASRQSIGEAQGHWAGWRLLEKWDSSIRDAYFPLKVREQYTEARKPLQTIVKKKGLKPMEQIGKGIEAMVDQKPELVRDFFGRHVQGEVWMAMDPHELQPRDPCPTCRIWFKEVKLAIPSEEASKPLGEIWAKHRPHQCAESDAHRQAMRGAGGGQRRNSTQQ